MGPEPTPSGSRALQFLVSETGIANLGKKKKHLNSSSSQDHSGSFFKKKKLFFYFPLAIYLHKTKKTGYFYMGTRLPRGDAEPFLKHQVMEV